MHKNSKKIIIIAIIISALLVVTIGVLLYILTDIFKPANVTFLKYASKNADVLSSIFNVKEENDYINKLESNKYESNATISSNTTINNQTDFSDIINKFNVNIDTKSDKPDNKLYTKLSVNYDNNNIGNLEFNDQNDIYGIKFSDVVTKYVSVQNNDLKSVAEKLGMDSTNVPDQVNNYSIGDILSAISFTDDEKEKLASEYGTTIINTMPKDSFSKQSNQMITIDGATVTANACVLNTNKQQLEELAIKILNQLSSDQIILSKIDNMDSKITNDDTLKTKLRDEYTNQISQIVNNLTDAVNSGNDASINVKIIVYSKNGKLIRTAINTDYVKTNIDVSQNDDKNNSKDSMNIEIDETTETNLQSYILKLNKSKDATTQDIDITLQQNKDNNTTFTGEVQRIRKQEGNSLSTEINAKALQDNNNYQLTYKNNISIVDNTDIEEITDNNNILLNNQSAENVQKIRDIIIQKETEKLSTAIEPILTRIFAETLITSAGDIIEQEQSSVNVSSNSDAEKNSFNAKFEGYTGSKVKYSNIQTLLANLKDYASSVNIDDSTGQITISIQKNVQSSVSLDEANSKLDSTKTYNVNLEYDNDNIANKIIIKANS